MFFTRIQINNMFEKWMDQYECECENIFGNYFRSIRYNNLQEKDKIWWHITLYLKVNAKYALLLLYVMMSSKSELAAIFGECDW